MTSLFSRKSLWAIGGLALLFRLGALAAADRPADLFLLPDSVEYDHLGWNIAHNGQYSLSDGPPWSPDLTRTPVYPLFIALLYIVAGRQPATIALCQASLGALTCVFVFALAERSLGRVGAIVTAAMLAVDPLTLRYSNFLLSETLFTSLFIGSVACLLVYCRKPQFLSAAALGGLTGLAILCRPIAIFWPAVLVPLFIGLAWRQRRWQPLGHVALFFGLIALEIAPWMVRNAYAGPEVLSTVPAINLYEHRAAAVMAFDENITVDEAHERLVERRRQAVQDGNLDSRQEYEWMEKTGLQIIRNSPGAYLCVNAQGMGRMFGPDDRRVPLFTLSPHAITCLETCFLVVLYPLAVVGLILGWRRDCRLMILILTAVIVYFAVISGPEAYARFRVPIMPAIVLLAGTGLASFARLWTCCRKRVPSTQQ